MSHSPERAEKICLNCRAQVAGRYCQVCGQENIEPRQSFWALVSHFFEDITHFDGKFFQTGRLLISRPGFLPAEYIRGRRARYLHPIRMYVFTSAVFFFVFYAAVPRINTGSAYGGSAGVAAAEKDSMPFVLSVGKSSGWLGELTQSWMAKVNVKYNGRPDVWLDDFAEKFVHSLPYLLFLSLPLYAWYLKILYIRKHYLYTDHAIFLIYLYIFTFLVMLAYFALGKLEGLAYAGWLRFLTLPLLLCGILYTVWAMKRFYQDKGGRLVLRFIIFNILAGITAILLFVVFLLFTLIRLG